MLLRLCLLRGDEVRRFGAAHAFPRHLANYFGGREDLFLALARHGFNTGIFAHSLRKNAIILNGLAILISDIGWRWSGAAFRLLQKIRKAAARSRTAWSRGPNLWMSGNSLTKRLIRSRQI